MPRDTERIERNRSALQEAGLDAIICALPSNVLLLSGYWPVVGTSLAIATSDGRVALVVPKGEEELARSGHADEVRTFAPGSLERLTSALESVRAPLAEVARALHIKQGGALAYESDATFEPSSYAAMHLYGASIRALIADAMPRVNAAPAGELLKQLRAVLTPFEVDRVRATCRIAEAAFTEGAWKLRAGSTETEAAAHFRAPLSTKGALHQGIERADGFTYCMSGANAAQAYAAYQRSRAKVIAPDEFALIHCNSYADGYWTDITRTFCTGEPDGRKRRMYEAVFDARQAALEAIHPGVPAAEVDKAAREVMKARGFAKEFKHGLGHGVGFAAINHNARPRLHPASQDMLEIGMVFNIEPAIYFDGYGGLRHCDMVAVTERGAELLTPFLSDIEQLIIA